MKILSFISILFVFLIFAGSISAALDCSPITGKDKDSIECKFGTISPPPVIADFLKTDSTGTGALSQFLSNLVVLIFSLATIVLIFMIIWGAFDWLVSEGDKEKLSGAQKKIISAFVGFILLAIAFAILRIFGQFTGFTFFKTWKVVSYTTTAGTEAPLYYLCRDGITTVALQNDPSKVCQ